jgi:hypothetical protein
VEQLCFLPIVLELASRTPLRLCTAHTELSEPDDPNNPHSVCHRAEG